MHKTQIQTIFTLIVSVLGLISCTSEKSTVIQGEDLNVSELKGQNSDKTYSLAKDLKELDLAGRLTIGSLETTNFNNKPITIKMESRCQGTKQQETHRQTSYWQNTAHLPVIELISKDTLLLIDSQSIYCDFTMIVTNSLSSSHTSEINRIKIKDWRALNNLESPLLNNPLISYDTSAREHITQNTQSKHVYLQCQDFRTSSNQKNVTLETLLKERQNDLRLSHPIQDCRLLIDTEKKRKISQIFKLQMPFKPLETQVRLTGLDPKAKLVSSVHVMETRIYNPNSFSLHVTVDQSAPSTYTLQPAYLFNRNANIYLGSIENRKIQWNPRLEPRRLSSEKNKINFIIDPDEDIFVDGTIQLNKNCQSNFTFNYADSVQFIGYNFDVTFTPQFKIQLNQDKATAIPFKINQANINSAAKHPYWKIYQQPNIVANYSAMMDPQFKLTPAQLIPQLLKHYSQGEFMAPKHLNTSVEVPYRGCL